MRKIALLIPELNIGGAERFVSRLTSILCDTYDVHLILFEDTFVEYEFSGKLINMNCKSADGLIRKVQNVFIRTIKLYHIKKNHNFDVVISFLDGANIVNVLSHYKKTRNFVSIRNYPHESSFLKKVQYITVSLLANKTITVSKEIEKYFNNIFIPKHKTVTIYNCYDLQRIKDSSVDNLPVELEGFISNSFVFVSMGRIMYQKGFWHLIKAFKIVCDNYPYSKLVIIGVDYSNGKADNLINDLNLRQNVYFAGKQNNPFKILSRCNVYVLSSIYEGFPNAMVEAMGSGLPVVAANCKSGPKEILSYNFDDFDYDVDYIESDFGIITRSLEVEENWDKDFITVGERLLAKGMLKFIESSEFTKKYSDLSLERSTIYNYAKCKEDYMKIIDE